MGWGSDICLHTHHSFYINVFCFVLDCSCVIERIEGVLHLDGAHKLHRVIFRPYL